MLFEPGENLIFLYLVANIFNDFRDAATKGEGQIAGTLWFKRTEAGVGIVDVFAQRDFDDVYAQRRGTGIDSRLGRYRRILRADASGQEREGSQMPAGEL